MTRKRLKKLLMSYGIQRNEAEGLCYIAWSSGKTYAEWFATDGKTIVALKMLQKSVVKFGMIFKKVACEMAKSIEPMALFVKEFLRRISMFSNNCISDGDAAELTLSDLTHCVHGCEQEQV